MPQISIGKKGPPGPPLKSGKFVCPKCDKVFEKKWSLKSHRLSRHAWSLETNAVASLELIKDFKKKQHHAVVADISWRRQKQLTNPPVALTTHPLLLSSH